jgi:hypothetical protein
MMPLIFQRLLGYKNPRQTAEHNKGFGGVYLTFKADDHIFPQKLLTWFINSIGQISCWMQAPLSEFPKP